ncbi:tetratricopeptide repeat protein [Qipengyuania sp. JC766]|uniref:tetratricopeptide repeat protein n=1 Tax=Qipengyuania sp. JC766 TaxID=3232139 RepID=UPI00345A49F7
MIIRPIRPIAAGLAAMAVLCVAPPAVAQDNAEARIRKLESEVRALQRRVFPGADGVYFEPEITTPQGTPSTSTTPSTTAVTDILARLDALESQLASLTAQGEQNANELRLLSERVETLEEARVEMPVPGTTTVDSNLGAMTGSSGGTAAPSQSTTPARAAPSPERLAAVQAIAKPSTDDAGDDEYSYGFRLWDAGFYPEAQQQLTMFVEEYPNHWRTTYGRNLLGRAYLDDGQPASAAPWFLQNYQANKTDARAPDSLLYLAEAMIAQNDTRRACIALAEFGETYPAVASGRLSADYQRSLGRVDCD